MKRQSANIFHQFFPLCCCSTRLFVALLCVLHSQEQKERSWATPTRAKKAFENLNFSSFSLHCWPVLCLPTTNSIEMETGPVREKSFVPDESLKGCCQSTTGVFYILSMVKRKLFHFSSLSKKNFHQQHNSIEVVGKWLKPFFG